MLILVTGGLLWARLYSKRTSSLKKKRVQKRGARRTRPIRDEDRIIYSAIRPQPQEFVNNDNNNLLETIPEELSEKRFDTLSTNSSVDLDKISRDPEFKKEPMSYLRRIGATDFELQTLMKHPNFVNDPLAALRVPQKSTSVTVSIGDQMMTKSAKSLVIDEQINPKEKADDENFVESVEAQTDQ